MLDALCRDIGRPPGNIARACGGTVTVPADLAGTRPADRKPGRLDLRPRSGAWRDGVFLRHGPGAEHALLGARRQARARDANQPAGVEDLALGILAVNEGLVPPILSALGVSGPALSTAILDRYHPAS